MFYLSKKYQKYLGFNDYWLILIGIPVVTLVIPLLFFDEFDSPNAVDLSIAKLARSAFYVILYWFIARTLAIFLRMRLPSPDDFRKRITLQGIVLVFVVIVICPVIEVVECLRETYSWDYYLLASFRSTLISLILISLCMGIYETIYYMTLWKKSVLESEKLKKEQLASQLQTLRNQVNPHFLFNSLNTLSAVIPEDTDLAVRFVENLSKVYRYILEIKDSDLIPLEDELNCVDSYLFLLHTRFGDKLRIDIDLEGLGEHLMVVPMSLQLLIENALKHNIASKSRPLTVAIRAAKKDVLMVKNNLQLKLETAPSTNVGIENINSRLQILNLPDLVINKTNSFFAVELPLLKVEHHASIDH